MKSHQRFSNIQSSDYMPQKQKFTPPYQKLQPSRSPNNSNTPSLEPAPHGVIHQTSSISASRSGRKSNDQALRNFMIDPEDYKPKRVGLRQKKKAIVIEYIKRSTQEKFIHNIKVYRYTDAKTFGISVSRSGSFKAALAKEVEKIVDSIYGDHCEFLPPEKVTRDQIEDLVRQILSYNQSKKFQENINEWNQRDRRSSLTNKGETQHAQKTTMSSTPGKSMISPISAGGAGAGHQKNVRQGKSTLSGGKNSNNSNNLLNPASNQRPVSDLSASSSFQAGNSSSGKKHNFFQQRAVSSTVGQGQNQRSGSPERATGHNEGEIIYEGDDTKNLLNQKGRRAQSAMTQNSRLSNLPSTTTKTGQTTGQAWNSRSRQQFSESMSQSYGQEDDANSQSYNTVSKSLTDLADLPLPTQKKVPVFDDQGFDDWNFEEVEEESKPASPALPAAVNNDKSDLPSLSNMAKPTNTNSKFDPLNQDILKQENPKSEWKPANVDLTKKPAVKTSPQKDKLAASISRSEDGWGDEWNVSPEPRKKQPIIPVNPNLFNYDKLDLNKLPDQELERHKAAMDVEYQKKFVGKDDPNFKYDKRVEFKPVENAEADWDESDDYIDDEVGQVSYDQAESDYSDEF